MLMSKRLLFYGMLMLVAGCKTTQKQVITPKPDTQQSTVVTPPKPEKVVGADTASIKAGLWPRSAYAQVKIYVYNLHKLYLHGEGSLSIIMEKDSLNPDVADPDGLLLTPAQVKRLIPMLNSSNKPYEKRGFNPHHGIVFYDGKGKPVAYTNICIESQQSRFSGTIGNNVGYEGFVEFLKELQLPTDGEGYHRYYQRFEHKR